MNAVAELAVEQAVALAQERVPAGARLIGIGWSTVDLERAAAELGVDVHVAEADPVLGARCRTVVRPDAVSLVLLEPSTEGRLAASLARLGEGPAVTWWEVDSVDGSAVLEAAPGPLGIARLLRDGHRDGRWSFLRERRAATIRA